jgi:hypothetical protein
VTTDPVDATSADQIFVGTSVAEIFLLRQSRLAFTVTDLRPFDLKDLPIAAGCAVPLEYTIAVTNNGPSCVAQAAGTLVDLTEGAAGITFTVPASLAPEDAETPVGGTYSVSPLGLWTIAAGESVNNVLGLNRSLAVTRSASQGLFSGNLSAPFYPFFRRTRVKDFDTADEDTTILDLFYDVQRYGDLKLNFFVSAPGFVTNRLANIVAGKLTASPSAAASAAPFVELQVTNNGCLDIDNAELAVKIDLPAGVFEISAANVVEESGPDSSVRTVNTGPLAAGATFKQKFHLRVCQNALASASSLSFIAWVVATTDVIGRQLLINNADDTLVQTVPIFREGDLTVTLTCEAPKLIADINAVSSESSLLSSSSSSSSSSSESSVRDVELIKITRCTAQVSNDGFSDIGAKVNLNWVLPRETTLARWASTSKSQFVATSSGGVWAARAATTVIPVNCAGVPPAADKLELDFASLESGTIEVCARVAPTTGTVTVTGSLGQCATVQV